VFRQLSTHQFISGIEEVVTAYMKLAPDALIRPTHPPPNYFPTHAAYSTFFCFFLFWQTFYLALNVELFYGFGILNELAKLISDSVDDLRKSQPIKVPFGHLIISNLPQYYTYAPSARRNTFTISLTISFSSFV